MWNNSSFPICFETWNSQAVVLSSTVVKLLLVLPASVYVLFLGFQQCRRQQTSLKTASHADYFTFHMISSQLISVSTMLAFLGGFSFESDALTKIGYYCNTVTHVVEMDVHCLTCVDRYLAVVHPVAYHKQGKTSGKRLRNAAMAVAWLSSCSYLGIVQMEYPQFPTELIVCLLGAALVIICFCSVAVLCALLRPGPGDGERVDRSKRKAFHTISAIMGVLLFWLTGMLICLMLQYSSLSNADKCIVFFSSLLFNIPSQLVLPLLYLKREGKLLCCKK